MSVAFYLPGNVPVYTFSLFVGIGAAIGLTWTAVQAGEEARQRLDAGLWSLLGALAGGRAAYVALSWAYFRPRPLEIFEVYRGGLSGLGALGGGLAALALAANLQGESVGETADGLLPLTTSVAASAWLGCWLSGCAYGPQLISGWAVYAWDEWGTLGARWPTQLVGALSALALFGLIEWQKERLPIPGQAASLWSAAYGLAYFALTYVRADPLPVWNGLRLDAWGALGMAAAALIAFALFSVLGRRQSLSAD